MCVLDVCASLRDRASLHGHVCLCAWGWIISLQEITSHSLSSVDRMPQAWIQIFKADLKYPAVLDWVSCIGLGSHVSMWMSGFVLLWIFTLVYPFQLVCCRKAWSRWSCCHTRQAGLPSFRLNLSSWTSVNLFLSSLTLFPMYAWCTVL